MATPLSPEIICKKRENLQFWKLPSTCKTKDYYLTKSGMVYQGVILWNSLENETRSSDRFIILKNNFKNQNCTQTSRLNKCSSFLEKLTRLVFKRNL